MALGAHTIKPTNGSTRTPKRVGRGNASGKGTYAARGLKGQRARSGGKGGAQKRAFKKQLQKVPKLRGFKSFKVRPETVTLATLERIATEGSVITPYYLLEHKVVRNAQNGVKIVATGTLTKKMTFKDCFASKKALEAIEKTGGKLVY